jgi:hypothetical protein
MRARILGCFGCLVGFVLWSACGGTGSSGFNNDGGENGKGGHNGAGGSGGINLSGDSGSGGDTGKCTGIACNVKSCGGGSETTVTGYVYAPNGQLPLYDVDVFIPNAPLEPLPQGVQCQNCGTPLTGNPITTALSDPTGHFTLTGVPSGANIPIVVQLGKWRRQQYIPMVASCTTTTLTDPTMTRLPQSQMDSDPPNTASMPHVALTTGGCDQMGCMLTKLGIDATEFGSQADGYATAIHVYNGSGGGMISSATTPAMNLWGDQTQLFQYDEAIFSCECSEALVSKGSVGLGGAPFGVVTNYLNAGGRIFTTDFQYTWYKYSPDPKIGEAAAGSDIIGLGSIHGGAPPGTSPMTLSTTIPKAVSLAAWLKNIFSGVPLPSGAMYTLDSFSQMGQIEPDVTWGNIQYLDPSSTITWASSAYVASSGFPPYGAPPPPPASAGGIEPRIFTVDTPVGDKSTEQCGRGLHIDAHVDQSDGQIVGPGYPTAGCGVPLKPDEAAFAFFFFDLSSCISNEHYSPPPPPVK